MMERSYGLLTPKAQAYLDSAGERLKSQSFHEIAKNIRTTVGAHEEWRRKSINLNAAENSLSRTSRRLLDSDLATRLTEGFPGDKDFPADRQNRFIDEIEATLIHLLRQLFKATYVEWRPVSTSMANATLFFSLTAPGDTILVQSEASGGNYSYNPAGPPRAARLRVEPLPFIDDTFEVDADAAYEAIVSHRPSLVVVGGSNVLFPYPLAPLREAADCVGAKLIFDGAHLSLLIANGMFQDPLREGASALTISTHKVLCGAVGGAILTNDDELADRVLPYSFPTLLQTRDQNKFAATAHALAEMAEFGRDYASAMVANARALGNALQAEGFEVLASNRGFTETHQLFVYISNDDADEFEDLCQRANLLVTRAQRMGERSAIRLTSQEFTRRGLSEEHMPQIASWLRRVVVEREAPELIADELAEFLEDFQDFRYSFDGHDDAPDFEQGQQ